MGDNTYGECGIKKSSKLDYIRINETLAGKKIRKIEVGDRHTLVLTEDGKVYACGDNSDFQCSGVDDRNEVLQEISAELKDMPIDIVAGGNSSILVTGFNVIRQRRYVCLG